MNDRGEAWRQSYSQAEKEAFTGVDKGNLVHRDVLKTAKTVKANNPALGMYGCRSIGIMHGVLAS